ncbi:hypothetical protein [Terracidiphilus gabretensis]|uniref:hypothetical protein n=1 Tax=Terracidiphilus gabretensis TaxID=1577687 RepID=UPI00071B32C7|nr:hypothetical protein [Terracidiphilus gabretensis]
MRARLLCLTLCAAALLFVATPARADNGNSVQFFTDLRIDPNKSVENAVCFFCSVHAEGEINGNLVVLFGSAHISNAVHQNVVSIFSSVTAQPNASIEQNVVNIFGNVRLGDGAHVGQNIVALFGATEFAPTTIIDGNRVIMPFWIFGIPTLLIGLVIYVIVREVRERRYRRQWMASQAMGPRV